MSRLVGSIVVAGVFALGSACGDDGGTTSTTSTGGASGAGASGGGGAGQGGAGQGGAATGGAAQGGMTSTGGAGTGGGATAAPECTQDADCYLSSDCCECVGRPVGEAAPTCNLACIQSKCQELGVPLGSGTAQCRAGRCVSPLSCDESMVVCASPSPVCDPGEAPIIENGCYTGKCLSVLECASVGDCAACDGSPKPACVTETAQLSSTHCVDVTAPCASATCDCLGPSVCVGSFDLCFEATDHLSCECPTCLF